jgi:hypothetical protein
MHVLIYFKTGIGYNYKLIFALQQDNHQIKIYFFIKPVVESRTYPFDNKY